MYCVVWTYAVPPSLDEAAIRRQFAAVADRYTERWGATPERADWIVPHVAESAEGRIVGG